MSFWAFLNPSFRINKNGLGKKYLKNAKVQVKKRMRDKSLLFKRILFKRIKRYITRKRYRYYCRKGFFKKEMSRSHYFNVYYHRRTQYWQDILDLSKGSYRPNSSKIRKCFGSTRVYFNSKYQLQKKRTKRTKNFL